ncbi:IS3 family transposase [Propionivibrio sp.]|uniref:IS3 family transposase n=1 Tax=Propionivibrio sp. TaxID=2212460 RepID=UPI00344BB70F
MLRNTPGTRRMLVFLLTVGHTVNRKRVQRLMRLCKIAPILKCSADSQARQ